MILSVKQAACYWQNQPQFSDWYISMGKPLDVTTASSSFNKVMKMYLDPTNTVALKGEQYVTKEPLIDCVLKNPLEIHNLEGQTTTIDTNPDMTKWYKEIKNDKGGTVKVISSTGSGNTYIDQLNNTGRSVIGGHRIILLL